MKKEDILKMVTISKNGNSNAVNRMGCSENWYDPYYAIAQTFEIDELNKMTEECLNKLVLLAQNISESLY